MSNYKEAYHKAREEKKVADHNVKVAKLRYDLDKALLEAKLLAPAVRRKVVDNLDLGYLVQAASTVTQQDWSAHADGTDTDRDKLKAIGNRFMERYLDVEP